MKLKTLVLVDGKWKRFTKKMFGQRFEQVRVEQELGKKDLHLLDSYILKWPQ